MLTTGTVLYPGANNIAHRIMSTKYGSKCKQNGLSMLCRSMRMHAGVGSYNEGRPKQGYIIVTATSSCAFAIHTGVY